MPKRVTFSETNTVHIIPNEKWSAIQVNERMILFQQAIAEVRYEQYKCRIVAR